MGECPLLLLLLMYLHYKKRKKHNRCSKPCFYFNIYCPAQTFTGTFPHFSNITDLRMKQYKNLLHIISTTEYKRKRATMLTFSALKCLCCLPFCRLATEVHFDHSLEFFKDFVSFSVQQTCEKTDGVFCLSWERKKKEK